MQTELCHFSVCVLFELVCIPVKLIITLIQRLCKNYLTQVASCLRYGQSKMSRTPVHLAAVLNQGLIYIYLAAVLESGTHLYLNLIIISECAYLISTIL